MYEIPSLFKQRINQQIQNSQQFFQSLEEESITSIYLNNSKYNSKYAPQGKTIPWNENGIIFNERPSFIKDPLYHAGFYYPMEAASMFLNWVLKNTFNSNDNFSILDLCASPGGKSLILKDYFKNSLLVSNEIDKNRVHVLKENAVRFGTDNHIIIQSDAKKLQRSSLKFDLILVDAPCSGEGLFRKDPKSRTEWSEEKSSGCAIRQQNILDDVMPLLNHDGYIIYSTCTFNLKKI